MNEVIAAEIMAEARKTQVEQAVKKEKRRLRDFIRKRVKREEDADDILQDVFLQLASAVEPIGNLTAWLFRVARNRITDSYRKKRPDAIEDVFGGGEDEEHSLNWQDILPAVNDNPVERELLWTAVMAALDEIPPEQAEVFVKNELEGIPFRQLSAETGTPIPTLISRKRYAVMQLREKLALYYQEMLRE